MSERGVTTSSIQSGVYAPGENGISKAKKGFALTTVEST